MANEDALLDVKLSEEVFQIAAHRFIGQHWAVGAVSMVTGIYSQHLTGQRTVRKLGTRGGKSQQSRNKKLFCQLYSFLWPQLKRVTTQTKAALFTWGDVLQTSQRTDYLSVFITTVQTAKELYQMTENTLVDFKLPCPRGGCENRLKHIKMNCFWLNSGKVWCLHHCITFRPVRCTKDFAIEWKLDLLPKRPWRNTRGVLSLFPSKTS